MDGQSFTLGMAAGAVITWIGIFVWLWADTRSKR
jgi:hypothetical protein